MEHSRKIIYFAIYEDGIKVRPAGYMTIMSGSGSCEVQIFYRGREEEGNRLQPVYVFLDGSVFLGETFPVIAGEGTVRFQTRTADFAESGRSLEELETVYLDGRKSGICAGRIDGRAPVEVACTKTESKEQPGKTKKEQGLPYLLLLVLLLKRN